MPAGDQSTFCHSTPLESTRFLPVTIIQPGELEHCIAMGTNGRQMLVQMLMRSGNNHLSDPDRNGHFTVNGIS